MLEIAPTTASSEEPGLLHQIDGEIIMPAEYSIVPSIWQRLQNELLIKGIQDEILLRGLELACTELINNAIQHGSNEDSSKKIKIAWHIHDQVIDIGFWDKGKYKPQAAQLTQFHGGVCAESGRGLCMTLSIVDELFHEQSEEGQSFILRKRVSKKDSKSDYDPSLEIKMIEDLSEELSASYESLHMVGHLAEMLATTPNLKNFAEKSMRYISDLINPEQMVVWLGMHPHDGWRYFTSIGEKVGVFDGWNIEPEDIQFYQNEFWQDVVYHDSQKIELVHYFYCPIYFQGKIRGCMAVGRKKQKGEFSAGEISLIRVVADYIAVGLVHHLLNQEYQDNIRISQELEIGSRIQQSLLPSHYPAMRRAKIYGANKAAHEIGGDFFDVIHLSHNEGTLLVIADVMGKGVQSALLATILRTMLRSKASRARDPGKLLQEVNHLIYQDLNAAESFITCQLIYMPPEEDHFFLASAGHCPLLRINTLGEMSEINTNGVPLGLFENEKFESVMIPIHAHETFILMTDGLYEISNQTGDLLGMIQLKNELLNLWSSNPSQFCSRVFEFIQNYSSELQDDSTMLVLQINGE